MADNKLDNPDNGDDSNWIGVFYFNRNDKRLFPPKRKGYGWTINFANPHSVGCLIAMIAVVNIIVFFILRSI